ncbi:hypothetical protein Tco_0300253 [Tanacetum coccineum]
MHNNIMVAGSRDRPPMLAIGRYVQWQSRFLRYINTRPNGDALKKCILEEHYQSEKEAIHLLLTGIGDEIYSTVDACKTARDMWIAIERLQRNDNQTGQFGNQRTLTVAGARKTVGSQECRKPKRVKDYTYQKEKMLLCKQAEKGVPLQVEQADWLVDTDEEIDEQ